MVGYLAADNAKLLQHPLAGCYGVDAVVGNSTPISIRGKGTRWSVFSCLSLAIAAIPFDGVPETWPSSRHCHCTELDA